MSKAPEVRGAPADLTQRTESDESVIRTGGSIAIATLASRITGFIRTVMVLAMLGGAVSSAFQAAYVLPNMIAEVVLGAVLTAIVIPVLVRAETEDEDGGRDFVNRIFTLALSVLGVATVIAVVAAPILTVLNVGDGMVDKQLATTLAFLLLPAILFYGLSALFMAILNVKGVFKPGAWAPVLNNIVQIATLAIYFVLPGDMAVSITDPHVLVLGIGTTLGVVVQAFILIPYLRRSGVYLRIKWGIDARLRRFGNMAVAIIAYVVVLQIGLVITYRIAASAAESGIAVYATAWQLLQLPYGVLGVTILTAIMPRLSRNAAADDTESVAADLSLATRLTMLSLVPIVAFMTFFGPAIGVAVFNFGRFEAADAAQLGSVLAWGAFTLIPYAMTLVQLRVFYAREDAWTPTFMVLGITIVKVGTSYLGPVLFDDPDHIVRWLALSNGLGYLVGAIVGELLLRKRLGRVELTGVARTSILTLLVSVAVSAAVWALARVSGLSSLATGHGPAGALGYLAVTALIALPVSYVLLGAMKLPDMIAITGAVRRLLGRFVPALAPAPPSKEDHELDAVEMTVQFPRITDDGLVPYSGQVEVHRHFDRGSATWRSYAVHSGGATGMRDQEKGLPGSPGPSMRDRRRPGPPPSQQQRGGPAAVPVARGPRLLPGAVVAGGRYRLLESQGGSHQLRFWRAKDISLDREVGLTFVDPEQRFAPYSPGATDLPPNSAQAILERTRHLGRINTAGVARILDVVRNASGGIVVSEWVHGSSLREVSATSPSPTGAARAVRALAAAADRAHRDGTALSIDHPDRIRISTDGNAVLAFPATLHAARRASDVRGLGAVLYALLLDRWPLDATGTELTTTATSTRAIGGMNPAEPDAADETMPADPRSVDPRIPFEISAVASRALVGNRSISTAATVQHVLDQATVVDLPTDLLPAVDRDEPPLSVAPLSRTRRERLLGEGASGKRNATLLIGGGIFLLGLVVVLILALAGVFSPNDSGTETIFDDAQTTTSQAPPPAEPTELDVVSAQVVDADGDEEYSPNIENILTGDTPSWTTGPWLSPDFEGIDIELRLRAPATISSVTFTTPTPGFEVEIRSRPSAGSSYRTSIGSGAVTSDEPVSVASPGGVVYLLITIKTLPAYNGAYQAIIDQIGVQGLPAS